MHKGNPNRNDEINIDDSQPMLRRNGTERKRSGSHGSRRLSLRQSIPDAFHDAPNEGRKTMFKPVRRSLMSPPPEQNKSKSFGNQE